MSVDQTLEQVVTKALSEYINSEMFQKTVWQNANAFAREMMLERVREIVQSQQKKIVKAVNDLLKAEELGDQIVQTLKADLPRLLFQDNLEFSVRRSQKEE